MIRCHCNVIRVNRYNMIRQQDVNIKDVQYTYGCLLHTYTVIRPDNTEQRPNTRANMSIFPEY